jgi:hypothetical protein
MARTDATILQPLFKRWTHSHEEDTVSSLVFRPADHPFPPARGRVSYEIRSDGELLYGGIGPTDRQTVKRGTWSLSEDGRTLVLSVPDEVEQTLEIESLSDERLVVRRPGSR